MLGSRVERSAVAKGVLWGSVLVLSLSVIALLPTSGAPGAQGLAPGSPSAASSGNPLPGGTLLPAHAGTGTLAPGPAGGAVPMALLPDPVPPQVLASVKVGSTPMMAAYDSANGFVYVANTNSNNVSILNGTSLVATVDTGIALVGSPTYVLYDPGNGFVYVVDRYYFEGKVGAVSVLNGTSLQSTVLVGILPDSATYDASNGLVYVTDRGSGNVTVLSGNRTVANITVGTGPGASVYDAADGFVYVANAGSDNVTLLGGTSVAGSVSVGVGPDSLAYDAATGAVYVANNGSANVTVLHGAAVIGNPAVGANPSFAMFDGGNGDVYVTNSNSSNVTILSGTTTLASAPAGADPVWAAYDGSNGFVYVVNYDASTVTVLDGTAWLGTVDVGAVPTSAAWDGADQDIYVTNAGSGNVSVIAIAYAVTFNETGLPGGSPWSVTVGTQSLSSTNSTVVFGELPGTHAYTVAGPAGYQVVASVPPSPVTVVATSVEVNVTFAALSNATYSLTFQETGLSSMCGRSTVWNVTVGNVTISSSKSVITFTEPNGTYGYTVGAPAGYTVESESPDSPVTINGTGVTVNVTFARGYTPRGLSITFYESGLRWGTTWCVSLGSTICSSSGEIRFSGLSSGTYSFTVPSVRGYTAQPASGNVTIYGHSVFVHIRFCGHQWHHCGGDFAFVASRSTDLPVDLR